MHAAAVAKIPYLHLYVHPKGVHQGEMPLAAAEQQEPAVAGIVDRVRPEVRQGQVEHLPRGVHVHRILH